MDSQRGGPFRELRPQRENPSPSPRNSSTFFLMSRAIRQWGMDPDKDVSIFSLGVPENIVAALSAGQIDAGLLSEPSRTVAMKARFKELAKLSELGIKTQSVTIATS